MGRVMVLLKLNVLKKQILYSFLIGRHSNLVSFLHTDMTKKEAFKLGSSLKFMFSKKVTKIEKIIMVNLTVTTYCQIDGEDFVNFCGLLRKRK